MSNSVITVQRFWCRRDTTSNWVSIDPVPAQAEWCVELDDLTSEIVSIKIGDGTLVWSSLPSRAIAIPPFDGSIYAMQDGEWLDITARLNP